MPLLAIEQWHYYADDYGITRLARVWIEAFQAWIMAGRHSWGMVVPAVVRRIRGCPGRGLVLGQPRQFQGCRALSNRFASFSILRRFLNSARRWLRRSGR